MNKFLPATTLFCAVNIFSVQNRPFEHFQVLDVPLFGPGWWIDSIRQNSRVPHDNQLQFTEEMPRESAGIPLNM